jgi:hypothetical protein
MRLGGVSVSLFIRLSHRSVSYLLFLHLRNYGKLLHQHIAGAARRGTAGWSQTTISAFPTISTFGGAQPCLSMDNTTYNQLAQCAMMQPSRLQQPMQAMFGPPIVPQPSLSMDLATDSQNTNFNLSANGDFTIQELDTTMLSAGFQKSSFGPPILPQMRPPAIHATCSEQGPFSFMTQRQVPVDNRSQQPPEATQLEARKPAQKRRPCLQRSGNMPKVGFGSSSWARNLVTRTLCGPSTKNLDSQPRKHSDFLVFLHAKLSYSERQYKAKILQMKLKRNVEEKYRKAVVRHIQYRKSAFGKVTKYVRVGRHRKTEATIQHWMKERPMNNLSLHGSPPSRKSISKVYEVLTEACSTFE